MFVKINIASQDKQEPDEPVIYQTTTDALPTLGISILSAARIRGSTPSNLRQRNLVGGEQFQNNVAVFAEGRTVCVLRRRFNPRAGAHSVRGAYTRPSRGGGRVSAKNCSGFL